MKTFIITICCLVCSIAIQAQSISYISYSYDNAGNRIERKYIDMSARIVGNINNNPTTEDGKGNTELSEVLPEPIHDKLVSHDITIFPNPTKGNMSVNITNVNSDEVAIIMVYDVSGKKYFETKYSGNTTNIDLSQQPSGNYFMKIEIAGQKSVWEIIKQ